jgi:hypothetical protein
MAGVNRRQYADNMRCIMTQLFRSRPLVRQRLHYFLVISPGRIWSNPQAPQVPHRDTVAAPVQQIKIIENYQLAQYRPANCINTGKRPTGIFPGTFCLDSFFYHGNRPQPDNYGQNPARAESFAYLLPADAFRNFLQGCAGYL